MRLRIILTVVALLVTLVRTQEDVTAEEETRDDRDKRQTQPYFTGGLPSIRPTPKPQPFTGGLQQTNIPRFQGLLGSSPQGFRTVTPVDEESEEIDRNTVSPTPSPLVLRQHQSPQIGQPAALCEQGSRCDQLFISLLLNSGPAVTAHSRYGSLCRTGVGAAALPASKCALCPRGKGGAVTARDSDTLSVLNCVWGVATVILSSRHVTCGSLTLEYIPIT
ncbi:hypothetical protein J6590_019480 [Homalodisca vitripennis]|nr:hypothetical protein J6590_019480 [Homalodisca vitripennis]